MTNATKPFDALMDITARPQTVFVRGEGSYLWDDGGRRYLDFIQGWAVNCPRPFTASAGAGPLGSGQEPHHAEPGLLQRQGFGAGEGAGR